jgi:hypothetical protein
MVGPLPALDPFQYVRHVTVAARAGQKRHVLSEGFLCCIAEEALGSRVPAGNDTVQVLPDNRVI